MSAKLFSSRFCAAKLITLFIATALLVGCQSLKPKPNHAAADYWQGKIGIQLQHPTKKNYNFSFELNGNPTSGNLELYTMLSGKVAAIKWQQQGAVVDFGDKQKFFTNIDTLIKQTLRVDLTATELFSALKGQTITSSQWAADYSNYSSGRITLTETNAPQANKVKIFLFRP